MSDADLRRLERDPGETSRLVHARIRAGQVSRERLELAALLGDERARGALGRSPRRPRSVAALVELLARLGPEALVRAAAGAAREALATRELKRGTRAEGAEVAGLEGAEVWAACPCEAHLAACRARLEPPGPLPPPRDEALAAAWAVAHVLRVQGELQASWTVSTLEYAAVALRLREEHPGDLAGLIAPWLVPWLMGEADPVRTPPPTRVQRRLEELGERADAGDRDAALARELLLRARRGELPTGGLELAAQLGAAPAILALGELAPPGEEQLAAWLCRLRRSPEALARAALVLVAPLPMSPRGLTAWQQARDQLAVGPGWSAALAEAQRAAVVVRGPSIAAAADRAAGRAARLLWDTRLDSIAELATALRGAGVEASAARERVRAALLPWLVGGRDPLLDLAE